ncbi:hypothetical protein ScPMuIL_014479 [Solemya velum]
MAAHSMGSFGAYKHAYSRYIAGLRDSENNEARPETVWVTKRYIPSDLRTTAPVPRHKLLAPKILPASEEHWVPVTDPPLWRFDRGFEGTIFPSTPSTRSEEYSTLRQMFPSKGLPVKFSPQNWGTGTGRPPDYLEKLSRKRFPIINSPMTRYVDDMHLTNRLFKLH